MTILALAPALLAGCAAPGAEPAETPATPPAAAPSAAAPHGPSLGGLCDASAAVVLGRSLVVADDERNRLVVFDAAALASAAPGAVVPDLQRIDLAELSPAFGGKEADLEGMSLSADGLLWIVGSHDTGKGTEPLEPRRRLVALRWREAGGLLTLELAGLSVGLLDGADPPLQEALAGTRGRTAKDPAGLSVEGLAADGAGRLWVGFRHPVSPEGALLARVDAPGSALAGGPIGLAFAGRWPLGGRGIRSMEWVGDPARPEELLVVAGPGEGPGFALFRAWTSGGRAPERLEADLGDLTPEALVRIGAEWWVLSDDGQRELDGAPCKDAPRERRRARAARLPPGW